LKKVIVSLALGVLIGVILANFALPKIYALVIENGRYILLIGLVLITITWLIYLFFDRIVKKIINVAVPEYEELVADSVELFKRVSNEEGTESVLNQSEIIAKKIAVKYAEARTRRFTVTVIFSIFSMLAGLLGVTLLKTQNDIMLQGNDMMKQEQLRSHIAYYRGLAERRHRDLRSGNPLPNSLDEIFEDYRIAIDCLFNAGIIYEFDYNNLDFRSGNMYNYELEGKDISRPRFSHTNFRAVSFSESVFNEATFYFCSFQDSCKFNGSIFNKPIITYCEFNEMGFENVVFNSWDKHKDKNQLENSIFIGANISNSEIRDIIRERGGILTLTELKNRINQIKHNDKSFSKNTYDKSLELEWLEEKFNYYNMIGS